MKLASTGTPERYEIPGQDDMPAGERVAYLLRVPNVLDRARFFRELRNVGARFHPTGTMRATFRRSLETLFAAKADAPHLKAGLAALDRLEALEAEIGEAQTEIKDILEERERLAAAGEGDLPELPEAFTALVAKSRDAAHVLDDFEERVSEADPSYRALQSDNEVYFDFAGAVGAAMFLEGWSGRDRDFARNGRGPSDAALASIPRIELQLLGMKVIDMFRPSEGERKNSPSPSPGTSGETASMNSSKPHRTTRSKATASKSPSSASPA